MSRIAIVKVRSPHDLQWSPPPWLATALRLVGAGRVARRLEETRDKAFMPQLTLPYLAALGEVYNQRAGKQHTFDVHDAPEEKLRLGSYDMVWLTAGTPASLATYRLADRLRARNIPVVIGGIHASTLPDEAAAHATSVFVGEAEETLFDLLHDFDAGQLKPRYNGGRHAALSGLPVPRWSGPDCSWVVPVQTSRGCRNACSFCSTTRYQGASRRHRPVADVVAELRALQDRGVLTREKTVFFTDNNIVSDTDHRRGQRDTRYARELFEALIPLRISWVGQGEVEVGEDRELTDLMASAGCYLLLIGLESVSQRNLDGLGKRSNAVERYVASLETLHRHGIANIGCFILGLDEDTPDVFSATGDFIEKYVEIPQVSLLTPFPGTALYRKLKSEGRILHEDWSRYDITHVVHRPLSMTPEELEAGYRQLTARIYSPLAMFRRSLRYAFRSTVNHRPRISHKDRFAAIFAPNLIYRRLSLLGRETQAVPFPVTTVPRIEDDQTYAAAG